MGRKSVLVLAVLIACVYAGAIVAGMHAKGVLGYDYFALGENKAVWAAPRLSGADERVRRGAMIFNETPLYASAHVGGKVSCGSCHAEGGIQPYASPMVGTPGTFPQFNQRAGHVISLKDRIEECFVRSENGTPIGYESDEMMSLVAYIEWLSKPRVGMRAFTGRGLVALPELTGDPVRGEGIYRAQCSGCHGANGEGRAPAFPPLWGAESFNDGAGMHGVKKMAAFVQHNMPQNRMGILSPQDAFDVAEFIHRQPRPKFNEEFKHF